MSVVKDLAKKAVKETVVKIATAFAAIIEPFSGFLDAIKSLFSFKGLDEGIEMMDGLKKVKEAQDSISKDEKQEQKQEKKQRIEFVQEQKQNNSMKM